MSQSHPRHISVYLTVPQVAQSLELSPHWIYDRIVDFVTGIDKILLDQTTFTTLTNTANGSLTASEFAVIDESVNGATVVGASIARIVFNRFNGDLFYNPDGATAGLGLGGYFAKLSGVSSMSATDFALQA
ncbi:hemolysin-type calcium-binding region (plasmid) [Tolypothrix tenuis PCC 7101]|uniref:Hemolysin-type calcium-binding region n=1 Tax=Tolypothrix tenuis PCC 7101 TaxID=231146 RepID=A0A1Z4NBB6_9CYAN|nr:hypothetical protein [Aulosira sp. FACHB-113]BAY35528.1 hemolysin-type calcium-binding region [Nostoc carneum NIES-2107]BAZ03014.1 hemolysin-type calcium-binding region [Tolypothrix tenuis PCC 7101]BAZ78062.1 hemolysin-type calcium-binding region [Aulosira laxa NIES-50]